MSVQDSILLSVKKLLGTYVDENVTSFDDDLIIYTNSALATLRQLGIGPQTGFTITGEYETWEDLGITDPEMFAMVKPYVANKVRTMFDPPTSGIVSQSLNDTLRELEWRLIVTKEIEQGG